jgi:hypothetical protein
MSEKIYREQAAYLRERAKTVAVGFREDFLKLAEVWENEAALLRVRALPPARA